MSQKPAKPKDATGVDRRDVLRVGAAGALAAGAAGSGGCAALDALDRTGLAQPDGALSETDVRRWCTELDVGLAAIDRGKSLSHLLPGVDLDDPLERAEMKRIDTLGRKALRGLTFASMVTALPEEHRSHPEVTRRVAQYQPELDEAVLGMSAELASQTREDNRALQRELKRNPDLPLKVAALLDGPARELGVPRQSRKQMKRILATVGWRLQRQSPEAVFDEYVTKVKKLAGQSGQLAEYQRALATASLERSLFAQGRPPVAYLGQDWKAESSEKGPLPKTGKTPLKPLQPEDKRQLRRASRELTAGGIVLGVGLATFGAAAVAAFGLGLVPVGLALMTIGGVIVLSGIITLIVGGVRRSRARKRARAK